MSDKSMGLRQETPQVINHIEKRMAKPANEGKWRRRALSVAKHVGSALKGAGTLGQAVIETRAGKIIAATALGLAATQTSVGKDVTHRVVEGAQGAVNTTSEVFDNWMFEPKMENNPVALETIRRIHKDAPLNRGEYFEKNVITVGANPEQAQIDVYPVNSNFIRGTPVKPIGTIPVGTEFNRILITPGHFYHIGVNDYSKPENDPSVAGYLASETYGAVDCNVVASILVNSSGNEVPNLADNYPACFIPSTNLQKTSE